MTTGNENQKKIAIMQQDIEIVKRMNKIRHKIAVMSGKGVWVNQLFQLISLQLLQKKDTRQVS